VALIVDIGALQFQVNTKPAAWGASA